MRIKRIICVLTAALFGALTLAACAHKTPTDSTSGGKGKTPPDRGAAAYAVPKYDESLRMTIASSGLDVRVTPEAFAEAADLGFNLLYDNRSDFNKNAKAGWEMLNMAHAEGIKVVVKDTALVNSEFEGTHLSGPSSTKNIIWYQGHPAFAGVVVVDEPNVSTYPYLIEKYQIVRKLFPDKIAHVNTCLKSVPFIDHLEHFVTTIGIDDKLSYDFYAMFKDGTIDDNMFLYMEDAKRTAVKHNLPLASWILAIEHEKPKNSWGPAKKYAEVSEESLRWQIALNQTFGHDEVIYYCYNTPGDDTNYGWTYKDGMFKKEDGTKNEPIYNMAKTVNAEVHKWGYVYKSFEWQGISRVYGTAAPEWSLPIRLLKTAVQPSEIDGVKSIVSDNDLLIGYFKDGKGNNGLLITNASRPALKASAKFTVEFQGYDGVQVFEKGEPRIIPLTNGKAEIELEPAEGKFLIPLRLR